MPRYFFNVRSPAGLSVDDVGVELTSQAQVEIEAVKGARGLMAEELKAGRPVDHQSFEVFGEDGRLVLTLRFRDVLFVPDQLDED